MSGSPWKAASIPPAQLETLKKEIQDLQSKLATANKKIDTHAAKDKELDSARENVEEKSGGLNMLKMRIRLLENQAKQASGQPPNAGGQMDWVKVKKLEEQVANLKKDTYELATLETRV